MPAQSFMHKIWEPMSTVALGTALTVAVVLLATLFPNLTERLRNTVSDLQIGILPRPEASSLPVIVLVDEKSLDAYGQWPWPRHRVARLLDLLGRAGVAAVGVDTIFSERDRSSPIEVKRELKSSFDVTLPLEGIPESARDYEKILEKALRSGPFVLSYYFDFGSDRGGDCRLRSATAALLATRDMAHHPWQSLHRARGILCSIPTLNDAASAAGFINSRPDDDGIYRRTPLVIEWNGRIYPNLALQTLITAAKADRMSLWAISSGFSLQLDGRKVPLDAAGNLLLRFRGPSRSYEYISAADLLDGSIDHSRLSEKIVFLGVSATGLQEYRPIHYDPLYSGVEFHAAIVDNILAGDYLHRPADATLIETGGALILGVALSVLLAWSGPLISALIPLLLILATAATSQLLLLHAGMVLSPVLPVSTLMAVLLALSLLKYGREKLKSEAIQRQIHASQEAIIEGFCAMSEFRDPETGDHIKRTQNYVKALARHLRHHPRLNHELDDTTIELMYKTAPLHDIGKIGVPDAILLKPDALTDEEFEIMKKHTEYGAQVIDLIEARMGANDFLRIAREIILGHQEKWDGSGYPNGLSGDAIPLSARLMALGDVYDALISRRVYKPPFSHGTAVRMITEKKGTHFDPDVVDAFVEIEEEFKEIALRFLDSEEQKDVLLGNNSEGVERIQPHAASPEAVRPFENP